MNIVIQPQKTVNLPEVKILGVRDLFEEKTIIARIKNLPRPIVLWKGDAEYTAAGNWTNETASARAVEILSQTPIRWV